MKLKKVLALILSLCMILSTMGTVTFADDASVSVWNGTYPESKETNGWIDIKKVDDYKAENLYINSAADLAALAHIVNTWPGASNNPFKNKSIYLNVDIDLNNHPWIPIGPAQPLEKNRFYGSFYGQGHTISNLNVAEGYYYAGLFGKVPSWDYSQVFDGVTINNAKVASADETNKNKEGAGALLGGSTGSVISNCHVTGEIEISGDRYVGGLVGDSYAQISNCSVKATGTITATDYAAGGLVGQQCASNAQASKVENCEVEGINGLTISTDRAYVGGLVGYVPAASNEFSTINKVKVSSVTVSSATETGIGAAYIAAGYAATNATVSDVTTSVAGENSVPCDVIAKIGNTEYFSLNDAVTAAKTGETVEVLNDSTINSWVSPSGKNGVTINGNNKTITINAMDTNVNGGGLLVKASNLTINDLTVNLPSDSGEMPRLATMYSGLINNVTVNGGTFGLSVLGGGDVIVKDSVFTGQSGWTIETEALIGQDANVTITGCSFEDKAVIMYGDNYTFTNNKIEKAGEGVNVLGDAVITGNNFGDSTLNIDQGRTVTIENNIINSVEFPNWFGVAEENYSGLTVNANTLSDEAVAAFNKNLENDVTSVGYVATIGDQHYYSLADAVKALEDGDTLKIASGRYDGFDVLADNVTITGMTPDTEITINSIPGNAFIGVNANGLTVSDLKFIIPENLIQTGNYLDGYDGVIGYWSKNFDSGSAGITGYDVIDCSFVNEGSNVGTALWQFDSFNISGCSFENFNVGIYVMADNSALGTVFITNNTFTKVNEPVNAYWGKTGDNNDSIAVTRNTFVSAKDADEIKITIHDHSSKMEGLAGISDINLSGNTYGAETEVVLVDTKTTVTEDVKETIAAEENVTLDVKNVAVARIGDDKYFMSLDAAINGASNGDTIDLLGNTIAINESKDNMDKNKNLTFDNGTLDLTYAGSSDSMFTLYGSETLTFNNVNFVKRDIGTEAKFMCYFINLGSANAVVTFNNCDFNLDGKYIGEGTSGVGMYSSYIANNAGGKINLTDCNIESEYTNFIYQGGAVVTNCTYNGFADLDDGDTAGNFLNHNTFPTVISNSNITTRIFGLRNANGTVEIKDNTYVNAELFRISTPLAESDEAPVSVDATSTVEAYDIDVTLFNEDSEGTITAEANNIYVQFKQIDVDENGNDKLEGKDQYELVLAGAKNETTKEIINELASADLTINFDVLSTTTKNGNISYSIVAKDGVSLSNIYGTDRYMFNYNGVDIYEETGVAIVLGTITVEGYGSYYLGIEDLRAAEKDTNAVYATEIKNNIVDGFTPAVEKLVINNDFIYNDMVGAVEKEIKIPTRELTINIDFPNAIEDNVIAYQDMKVEITGNIDGVNQTIPYNLGTDGEWKLDNGDYVVTEDRLVLNEAYTVTVSGAGYRTARYTVTMTEDKVLNFWNNVRDDVKVVEEGKKSTETKITFLAGDIVKDNKINIYDLSAVVSYFGTSTETDAYSDYAKYDLNRDGVIDSKDVAYVLVSWDN